MRNFILIVLAIMATSLTLTAESRTAGITRVVGPKESLKYFQHRHPKFRLHEENFPIQQKTSARADNEIEVTYKFVCDEEAGERPIFQQFMIPVNGDFPAVAFPEDGVATFHCAPGEYDLVAMFQVEMKGAVIVARDNVTIDHDCEIIFDIAEATNHIVFAPLMPDGETMRMSVWDDEKEEFIYRGNIESANIGTRISHVAYGPVMNYNTLVIGDYVGSDGEIVDNMRWGDVWVNETAKFTFLYNTRVFSSEGCPIAVHIESDGCATKTYNNDPKSYEMISPAFAGAEFVPDEETGVGEGMAFIGQMNTVTAPRTTFNFSYSWADQMDCPENHYASFKTLGRNKPDFESTTLYTAKLYGRDGNFTHYGIFTPCFDIKGEKVENLISQFTSPQLVINGLQNDFYIYTQSGIPPFIEFNPVFSFSDIDGDFIFGNSCPIWVPAVGINGCRLGYVFTCRAGEIRSIDLLNHELDIKIDGETTIDSFGSLKDWSNPNGSFGIGKGNTSVDVTVRNRDLKIDDLWLIDGRATMHLDRSGDKVVAPVVQMLQFRDRENRVTDRFKEAGEVNMMIAAGSFEFDQGAYTASKLQELKVEVAPCGSDDFVELDAAIDDEVGLMPTYGWLYRTRLDKECPASSNGWYDLRLTAIDATGSWQTQLVSPAFSIGETSIETIERDVDAPAIFAAGNGIVAPDGARVYTLSGIETERHNLAPGLYIVVAGERTVKVAVR